MLGASLQKAAILRAAGVDIAIGGNDGGHRVREMRYFFEAYIRDAHVRAKIDAGHFADLNVNPTFTTRDLKEVPASWRKRIPEYIKDYVSLNPFL